MASKSKEVKVFTCPTFSSFDPRPANKGRSSLNSQTIWNFDESRQLPNGTGRTKRNPKYSKSKNEFDGAFNSITELGASQFTGKDKRAFENKKAISIGAKAAKNEKTPYHIFMKVQKGRKKRETKETELAKVSGIITGKRKKNMDSTRNRSAVKKRRGPTFKDGGPVPTYGGMGVKNGILSIRKKK